MTEQAKKTRQRRDLAQVAQEQLDKADRLIKRLTERRDALHEEMMTVQDELALVLRRREYLAANPDLRNGESAKATTVEGVEDEPTPGEQFVRERAALGPQAPGDPFEF
jgi:hypothetical protein